MCLLAVVFRSHPDAALIVAANRDEWLARPASPTRVLRADHPRILGGRDEEAHGTWLAVSERGLVAGLTNQPTPHGRNPSKKSRGLLPLMLANHATAEAAVKAFAEQVRSPEYNPCWMMVGDRRSLYYLDVTTRGIPGVRELGPGTWVLENRPLEAPSAKADWVRGALQAAPTWRGKTLVDNLGLLMRSHIVPDEEGALEPWRPITTRAACVHAGPYGTRSSTLALVPNDRHRRPDVWVADGPPCTVAYTRQNRLWQGP